MARNWVTGSLVLTSPPVDHSVSGITTPYAANENQTVMDACRINSSGKAQIAKADVIANANAIVCVADPAIAINATGNYLTHGYVRHDAITFGTVGGLVYLSTTGTTNNTLTQTQPAATNNVIQILGVAVAAHVMFWNPSLVQVEHS